MLKMNRSYPKTLTQWLLFYKGGEKFHFLILFYLLLPNDQYYFIFIILMISFATVMYIFGSFTFSNLETKIQYRKKMLCL